MTGALSVEVGGWHGFKEVCGEGEVDPQRDGVEALEAEDELVEEQARLLVQRADEGVPLVETQQDIHAPLQFGIPNV